MKSKWYRKFSRDRVSDRSTYNQESISTELIMVNEQRREGTPSAHEDD